MPFFAAPSGVISFVCFFLLLYGENYFEFKFALEDLLKRPVDLVEYNAVKNPYFKEELDETKQLIYGQAS